jgi:hypothetical protein
MVFAAQIPTPDIDSLPATEPIDLPLPLATVDDLRLERTGFDSYALCVEDSTVGFIDIVGRVYVAYLGPRADRAVEIAQALDLPSAVRRIADAL